MDESQVIKALAALSQETRLRILRFLVVRGHGGAAAGEIAEAVGASSSGVSFHLTTMANAGLLASERVSRSVIYRVDFDRMGELIGYLVKDCCKSHETVTACCGVAA
ncbi:MAG: metalloregulator ArsR/SmtB family transcription factor [Alphaproteobacteria bacterium]